MVMQLTILSNKFKAKFFVNLSLWTTKVSNTITAISVRNTWMQKIEIRISLKRDVGVLSCIDSLKLYTRIPLSVGSCRLIKKIFCLILSIQSLNFKAKGLCKIQRKITIIKCIRKKGKKMLTSHLKCIKI